MATDLNTNGDGPRKLALPKPERASLTAFSLYEKESNIDVEFKQDGVFCLVGANGLGKSTFLTAVNYAITGVVAQPGREFRGVADYYSRVRPYASNYFRGRINELDEEAAQIELVMRVGNLRYRIVRGMFDPDRLRELEITALDGSPELSDDDLLSEEERHDLYAERITKDAGLETFSQLVFLQLFVLTFDERRELLFWNARVLQASLYITFGLDSDRAKRADTLSRRVSGTESRARNFQWQATNVRSQLEALLEAGAEVEEEGDDAAETHRGLDDDRDEARLVLERLQGELSDTELGISKRSASLRALREEYDALWSQRLQGHGHPASHPVVTTSLQDKRCVLCGTEGAAIVDHIQGRIDVQHCPLCDSELSRGSHSGSDALERLKTLDAEIIEQQKAIAAADNAAKKLRADVEKAREKVRDITARLAEFEESNERALIRAGAGASGLEAVADRYRAQIAELQQQRDAERRKREDAREELRPIQEQVVTAYTAAEDEFVPNFRDLARAFLGIDLSVDFQTRRDTVGLLLTVEGTRRRAQDTLSESQRFFVDIALRMALAQQMSADDAKACLFIDTPEGSLDIAYESRAGEMFGMFVGRGFQIVMTANINTSQLLLRLAGTCGPERMVLERMTEWTSLTEVQAAEEQLFEDAWHEIRDALSTTE